jgi:gliding motility-associated-like protein
MIKYIYISLLFVCSLSYGQVLKLVAGDGTLGYSGDGGLAVDAQLEHPWDLTTDLQGNIYFSDQGNSAIRRVDVVSKEITTIVGTGLPGEGTNTDLSPNFAITSPSGITYHDNYLYFSDAGLDKIFKVNLTDSSVHHVAGSGTGTYAPDSTPATSASLGAPQGICIGTDGLVYFVESLNAIVRRIQTDGTLYTVSGIAGTFSSSDGPIASATFDYIFDIDIDDQNNIYIGEPTVGKIRKINQQTAIVSTVAGTGSLGDSPDGTIATSASLNAVHSVSVDNAGNIYIPDNDNYKVKKVDVSDGRVYTIAGDGTLGNSIIEDDPLGSQVGEPLGIHVDDNGVVYFSDISFETVKSISACVVASVPTITASTSDTISCNEQITLSLSGDLNSQDYWQWYAGSCGGDDAGSGSEIYPTLQQTTTFYAIAKGTCPGQDDCAYFIVQVSPCDQPSEEEEEINAFSPNGDGINDYLHINQASTNQTNEVAVFNRWGDRIKYIQNYDNENVYWNGSNEFGVAVEGGTYFYIFESDNVNFSKWISVTK